MCQGPLGKENPIASRRSPGEGSIYQRSSDGRWVGSLHLGWEHDGRKRKHVLGHTKREVQQKLADLKRQHALGVQVELSEQTVTQFLRKWLQYKKPHVRPRTYDGYRQYIEGHAIPEIGRLRLQKLRVSDVQGLLDSRVMTPRSVKALRDILRNALNDAVRWGEVERNVAQHAKPPTQVRKPVEAMTAEQAQALLKAMKGHRLEALFRVTLSVGLRRSEVLGLKWEDVDLKEGRLSVRRGLHRAPKNGGLILLEPKSEKSRRTVALPQMAVEALRRHRKVQAAERLRAGEAWVDNGFVFANYTGGPFEPNFASKEFKDVAAKAGLTLNFHQLRHGAATLMIAKGIPLKLIQETLGHSTIVITADTYGHVAPEVQRLAAIAMDEVLTAKLTATPTTSGD